jgi:hypothetical protein
MTVKIDPIEDYHEQYQETPEDATDTEVYEHAIETGAKEIKYLKTYIKILINRIKAANKKRIRVIDLRGEKNE